MTEVLSKLKIMVSNKMTLHRAFKNIYYFSVESEMEISHFIKIIFDHSLVLLFELLNSSNTNEILSILNSKDYTPSGPTAI